MMEGERVLRTLGRVQWQVGKPRLSVPVMLLAPVMEPDAPIIIYCWLAGIRLFGLRCPPGTCMPPGPPAASNYCPYTASQSAQELFFALALREADPRPRAEAAS